MNQFAALEALMLNFDINVQQQLIVAALDDFSAIAALPHVHGGQYGHTPWQWRAAVTQFVHDSLIAGLIAVLPVDERYRTKDAAEICLVLKHGDREHGLETDMAWYAIYFEGTQKLRDILGRFQLVSWDALNHELCLPLGERLAELNAVRF